jgi:hypothetical protein
MNNVKVQSFIAYLRPPEGVEALSRYLSAALKALNLRSDAQLAALLSIPASTVASWKRRGVVPDDRAEWLADNLLARMSHAWTGLPQVGTTARAAVVELLVRTGGDPMGLSPFPRSSTARSLGGLLALAEFLASQTGTPAQLFKSDDALAVADRLGEGMGLFARAAGFVADPSPQSSLERPASETRAD